MKKILCVDDDEKTLNLVGRFLAEKGYEVRTSNAPFIARLIAEEKPDLVLLDIDMPLLPGDKLVRVLRDHDYATSTRFLFFSGQGPAALRKAVQETGAAGAIPKDAGLDTLLAKITAVIGSP